MLTVLIISKMYIARVYCVQHSAEHCNITNFLVLTTLSLEINVLRLRKAKQVIQGHTTDCGIRIQIQAKWLRTPGSIHNPIIISTSFLSHIFIYV
jgi:hypothetical protein